VASWIFPKQNQTAQRRRFALARGFFVAGFFFALAKAWCDSCTALLDETLPNEALIKDSLGLVPSTKAKT